MQKETFNAVASMQRIRTKVTSLEMARDQKEKRIRRLQVQQRRDKEVYGQIKEEEDCLARFKKMSDDRLDTSHALFLKDKIKELTEANRVDQTNHLRAENQKFSATFVEANFAQSDHQKWVDTKKAAELKLREHLLTERINGYQRHYQIGWNIVQYMIDMTEVTYTEMGQDIDGEIAPIFWRRLQEKFIMFQDLLEEKENMFDKKKTSIGRFLKSDVNLKRTRGFQCYLAQDGKFGPEMLYSMFLQNKRDLKQQETSQPKIQFFETAVKSIIDESFPVVPELANPINLIDH
jgi:hypothetical protein